MLGTIAIPDRRWRNYAAGVLLGVALVTSAWLLRDDDGPRRVGALSRTDPPSPIAAAARVPDREVPEEPGTTATSAPRAGEV